MGLRARRPRPVSVFQSSGVLATRLGDRAVLNLFGSVLIHFVVIFGVGFIAVQEKPESVLPALRVTLADARLEKPEDASFTSLGPSISIRVPV